MSEVFKGSRKFHAKNKKRLDLLTGRRGPYVLAGREAAKSIDKNFNAEGRPKWAQRKGDYSHPILDKTGTMRDKAVADAKGTWRVSGDEHRLEIHSPRSQDGYPYGVKHQLIGMPARNVKWTFRKFWKMTAAERRATWKIFRTLFHTGRAK